MNNKDIKRDLNGSKEDNLLLKDERDRLITIIETAEDPIFVKDNDHRIILANHAFCDIFNLNIDAVIGKTLAENVPENERVHFLSVDRNVLDTGLTDAREESLTIGGVTKTIITKKARFIDSYGNKFLVGSIRDITANKLAEKNLKERIMEVEKLNGFMVNRELRMVELKKEIEDLKRAAGGK